MRSCLALVLLCACASARPAPEAPAPEAPGRRDAARRARDVTNEAFAALRGGDLDSLQPLVDDAVVVVGPRAGDVFTARSDALVALARGFARGRGHRVPVRELEVIPAASGRSAVVWGDVIVDFVVYRLSAVVAEKDDLWTVLALHLARPGRATAGPAPAPLPDARDPGAPAFERYAEQLEDRRDAIVLGTTAGEVTRGAKAIRKLWAKSPPGPVTRGPAVARVTGDGALAWVVATAGERRLLLVYEQGGGGWRLVAVHQSAPAP